MSSFCLIQDSRKFIVGEKKRPDILGPLIFSPFPWRHTEKESVILKLRDTNNLQPLGTIRSKRYFMASVIKVDLEQLGCVTYLYLPA